jgi:hypothetical protein
MTDIADVPSVFFLTKDFIQSTMSMFVSTFSDLLQSNSSGDGISVL